jgi:hypothetical protein
VKQVKKAERQSSGEKTPDRPEKKKSGWANVLAEMLEDARQQMAEQQPPESAKAPAGPPTGWDDIIPEQIPPRRETGKRPEFRQSKRPRQKSMMRKDAVQQKKPAFRPECLRCSASMKEIPNLGIPDQSGLINCDACGEQHKYRISDGELILQRTHAKRKTVIPAEKTDPKAAFMPGRESEIPLSAFEGRSGDVPEKSIHRRLNRKGLQNAVIWAEILGKPVGLRDMEI